MSTFAVHCICSQRQDNEPPKFNIILTEKDNKGEIFVSTYPISMDNAADLYHELADFLAANNVRLKP